MPTRNATRNSLKSSRLSRILPLILLLCACSADNGSREERARAVAYLTGDPTASSTEAMTYGDPGYWNQECKAGSATWTAAVQACNNPGQHPPICELIRNGCSGISASVLKKSSP